MSQLVASEIVRRKSVSARAAMIEKWVAIADYNRTLHNFNGVLQICAAFSNSCVFRLKKTWDKVPKAVNKNDTYSFRILLILEEPCCVELCFVH